MKNTRILFVVLALVLVVALVACGGERTPDVTEAPVVTTEAPAATEAPDVTEAPVVTTEAPVVTTEAPVTPVDVDYDTLYVGYNAATGSFDDAYLIANFEGGAPNYLYAIGNAKLVPYVGATYKTDELGNEYVDISDYIDFKDLFTVYTYPATETGNEKYTVEFVVRDKRDALTGASGDTVRDFSLRIGIYYLTFRQRAASFNLYSGGSSSDYLFFNETNSNPEFIRQLNIYSLTLDTKDSGDGIALNVYYNGVSGTPKNDLSEIAFTPDTTNPRYRMTQGPYDLYAFRVYSRMLTDEEVAQNHFVDIAKYLHLDLSAFLAADEAAKQGVYSAFQFYSIDTITKEEAQDLIEIMIS